jgi:hypothetical protein
MRISRTYVKLGLKSRILFLFQRLTRVVKQIESIPVDFSVIKSPERPRTALRANTVCFLGPL